VVTPRMVDVVVDTMRGAYPEITGTLDVVRKVVQREEEAFRATLQRGVEMLDGIVERGDVSGEDAFFLHDTLGFPIDLTREMAAERGRAVDIEGFDTRMQEQRVRARAAAVAGRDPRHEDAEYPIYPKTMWEPYSSRRDHHGVQLYGALNIDRLQAAG